MKTHSFSFCVSTLTIVALFFLSPFVGIKAQTTALYGTSILSTESTPDWYFISNSSTGEIFQLSADKTKLESATIPLASNSNYQFWRFATVGDNTVLINKGTEDYEKTVTFTASGNDWIMNIEDEALTISGTSASLGGAGTPLTFTKAPVGGGKEWVQLKSYRAAGATFLYDNNGIICHTATDDVNTASQNLRLELQDGGYFYLTAKTQPDKYVYDSDKNKNGNMKFSDTETPVKFVLHPLNNRKGYVQLTVQGVDISRIDYNGSGNPNAGLYTDNFTTAFGTRTNDGFRFAMVTYSEGFSDILTSAITAASQLLSNTFSGTDPGAYKEEDRNLLSDAILAAQGVNTNQEATEQEISAAAAVLNAAIVLYKSKVNQIKYSTEDDITWYYIASASTSSYVSGKAIVNVSSKDGDPLKYDTKRINSNMMWSFIKDDNGKVAIKNMATGRYFAKDLTQAKAGTVEDPQYNYTIALYEGASFSGTGFTIKSDASSQPIHAQNNNSVIVTWQVEAANPSSLWLLKEVSEDELDMEISITNSVVEQGRVTTGIGNTDLPILRARLLGEGTKGETTMKAIKGNLEGATSVSDVVKVKAYLASNDFELQPDKETATFLGEAIPQSDGTFTVTFDKPTKLQIGYNYLWVALDISENAKEGNKVDAQITGYVMGDDTEKVENNGNPQYDATIFLTEGTVVRPGDDGSRYYRIPAIATAQNGWLVAVTDKRYNSEGDLPNNIDVIAQVSKDNGKTWSAPQTIAGTAELGGDYGHGDPSIVTNRENGDIIVLITSKVGYFAGDGTNVPLMKVIVSHDNGLTWEKPVDVTSQVYGPGCTNSVTKSWLAAFPTSGSILQKRDGTLVVAMLGRNAQDQKVVHLALSKDGGKTWYAAKGNGTTNPDESKVVEKNNGDLILSVRASGENYKNITSDDGETWKLPAQTRYTGVKNAYCNGDFKLLTSTLDGNDKNRMLHTNCFANSRMNVSAVISYDEGNTWSSPKTICPRSSAYSALTILPDGTIGCYYEEGGLEGGYIMRYVRFSVDWLTGGEDDITSYYPVGYKGVAINNPMIEDNSFCVTSENGIISVTGATDYTITSLLGVNIPKGIGLNKGIYVVTANGKSVKTIVR